MMQETVTYVSDDQTLELPGVRIGYQALEDVLSHRLPSFYRTAYRLLGNAADTEDAVQDALLSAYKHLHQFNGQSQVSTWVTSIVSNSARMQLRRRLSRLHMSLDTISDRKEYSLSERLADNRPNPEEEYQWVELKARLREFVAHLSPRLRKTFQLCELQGLSVHETARILQVSEGTVKAQLHRARAKLTRMMRRGFVPPASIKEKKLWNS